MQNRVIRWGILGLGWIAERFVRDFKKLQGCELTALGSRDAAKAEQFKKQLGLTRARAYGSYQAVCADPAVDAVYVATPHTMHKENTLMALQAGKAVLCEKPLAVNRTQAEAMIHTARTQQLFLMEAMWTAFAPVIREIKALVVRGVIGEIRRITADLSLCLDWKPQGRIFNPALAGGALLDIGVYPLFLTQYLLGAEPRSIQALAHIGTTGVDEHTVAILEYPGARFAQVSVCTRLHTDSLARIEGTRGAITIPAFFMGRSARVEVTGKRPYTIHKTNGYHFQVQEVNTCLREDRYESTLMPLALSARVIRTMDTIREIIGLHYPCESSNSDFGSNPIQDCCCEREAGV